MAYDLAQANWHGRPVTVMGLGRHGGGLGAARFLALRGAQVTISDTAARADLAGSLSALDGLPIAGLQFGGHDGPEFGKPEFVVVNPAIRPTSPKLAALRTAGVRLISECELLLAHAPCTVFGVTGTNGKSTTCAMLADMLRADGRRVWLGGNIGGSLLDDVDAMRPDDWIVLEMSSFQLAHLGPRARMPRFAVITNFSANHLDWHGDAEHYLRAKQRLFAEFPDDGVAVLPTAGEVAAWDKITNRLSQRSWPVDKIAGLRVPGLHNRQNAALAAAAATAVGVDRSAILAALADFSGLSHRLQLVAGSGERRYYNDSKATTPEATQAALAAMEGRVWLLAGGLSKGTDFRGLAASVHRRATGVALFGAARADIAAALAKQLTGSAPAIHVCESLATAFAWCVNQSRAGDAILLSPACASHDQFADFAARGDAFCNLVRNCGAMRAQP